MNYTKTRQSELENMIRSGVVSRVQAFRDHDGWHIRFALGMNEKMQVLHTATGNRRRFAQLTTVADFLQMIGCDKFEVLTKEATK